MNISLSMDKKKIKNILLVLIVLTVGAVKSFAEEYKFVDDRELIASIRVQKKDIYLGVYPKGKIKQIQIDNPDPLQSLYLIGVDEKNKGALFVGKKESPGLFVVSDVPPGTYEIQSDDLNGLKFERNEVDFDEGSHHH